MFCQMVTSLRFLSFKGIWMMSLRLGESHSHYHKNQTQNQNGDGLIGLGKLFHYGGSMSYVKTEQLSPHFTLGEFFVTSHDAPLLWAEFQGHPQKEAIYNRLKQLAQRMERVRKEVGDRPITITSGWRSPRVNRAVGGAMRSKHLTGEACDFTVQGRTPRETQSMLEWWEGGMGYGKSFTHLDIRPAKARFQY